MTETRSGLEETPAHFLFGTRASTVRNMRLDLFLKISRLVPRRSLAQKLCEAGIVKVGGAVAKASKEVKIGDEIEIRRRDRLSKVRVTHVPETKNVSKASAAELYQLIEETKIEDDLP